MSRVESVSNDRHTFCHKRAAFAVSEENGLCCLLKPTKGYFHAVDMLPQLFLHPDSIQVFVSCARKSGRITSNRNRQKNLGSCCKNVQHSKMILEQLWLSFDNHIQLSRTLLYSSGKIKGWSMVLKRKEDIHHKLEGHKFISVFSPRTYHTRYIKFDWLTDWLIDWLIGWLVETKRYLTFIVMPHWYLHVFRGSFSVKTRSEREVFSLASFRIKEKPSRYLNVWFSSHFRMQP